jgi:hypothetical protein
MKDLLGEATKMKLLILSIASCYVMSGAIASAQTATDLTCTSCVGETDIANQAVTSAKIADGTIKTADIRPGAITTDKILNGTVSRNDLSPQVQDLLDGAIVNITIQRVTVSAGGVAGAECPSGRIPVSASCECDDANGTRNFGVLFSCTISGTGAVSACFDEAASFNPQLPAPLAIVRAVCLGAKTADGTPWVPTSTGLAVDAGGDDAAMARAADQAKWMLEQHGTFDAALAKLRSQRTEYESRTRQATK